MGRAGRQQPWEATTLEWSAPSPPGHGNFLPSRSSIADPYEYSVPGAARGLHAAVRAGAARSHGQIPYTVEERPDTGLTNGKLGIWLFLASEVMLFGALFSTYIILRIGRAGVAARRAERRGSARSTRSS